MASASLKESSPMQAAFISRKPKHPHACTVSTAEGSANSKKGQGGINASPEQGMVDAIACMRPNAGELSPRGLSLPIPKRDRSAGSSSNGKPHYSRLGFGTMEDIPNDVPDNQLQLRRIELFAEQFLSRVQAASRSSSPSTQQSSGNRPHHYSGDMAL